ncbi:hypothetical protein IL306_013804 [Fusarium sp. DS 682]|nr:hypothetical protein IL306_013804 [Fusarium sp. DS 682]
MPDGTKAKLSRKWSQEVEDMGGDGEWGPNGLSTARIKKKGLENPKPFLGSTTSSGSATFYFTSDNKLYMFDALESEIYVVKKPAMVDDLIGLVAQGKQTEIEMEELETE